MKWPRNYAPSYRDLKSAILRDRIASTHLGMRLEGFVSEQILNCHEGYIANNEEGDAGLIRVFSQRSAPISAALRVDINAPEEVDLADTEDGQ